MKKNCLLLTIIFACWIQFNLMADNYIIINQVMYDTPLNEQVVYPPYSNGEFFELYNGSNAAVSLNGWHITSTSPTELFNFPNISIASKSYLVVYYRHADSPDFSFENAYAPLTANTSVLFYDQHAVVLSNQGDTITLYNTQHEIVDQIYYDGTSHLTNPGRLYATNTDSIPLTQCVSLHRTWVEFDENGHAVTGASQWKQGNVSFGECQLSETTFGEHSLTGDQPLPTGTNYSMSVNPLDPTSRVSITNNGFSVSNGVRTQTVVQYFDGLGRPDEAIMMGVTPDKKDIVSLVSFDGKRNLYRQWLPVAMNTEGQRIEQESVISQAMDTYDPDHRPYIENAYENSAVNRLIKQRRPGKAYEEDHEAIQRYVLNSENDHVRIYSVNDDGSLYTNGLYFATRSLYKQISSDEDGKSVIVFIDQLGRKIMEKRAEMRLTMSMMNWGVCVLYYLAFLPSSIMERMH